MEKKKSPPAKIRHSFPFLFGDLKIKLSGSEQARFPEMIIILLFFWRGTIIRGKSDRCKLRLSFYE